MSRTAVAAPAPAPLDDLLETIDAMDGPTLREFLGRLRERYNLPEPAAHLSVRVTGTSATYGAEDWTRILNSRGWLIS